jgi:hypothetical protein
MDILLDFQPGFSAKHVPQAQETKVFIIFGLTIWG